MAFSKFQSLFIDLGIQLAACASFCLGVEGDLSVAGLFTQLGLERFRGVCILGFNSVEWFLSDIGAILAG